MKPSNIFEAVEAGSRKAVTEYLAQVHDRDESGGTALHHSVGGFHPRITYDLLAAGADPNAQDNRGKTPFHLAIERLLKPIAVNYPMEIGQIRDLTGHGARADMQDDKGNTVVHTLAADTLWSHGAVSLWNLLRSAGARNVPNAEGLRPSDVVHVEHPLHDWMERNVAAICRNLPA